MLSELVRLKPEPRVVNWMTAADESLLYISVLTLGEIRKGAATLTHSKRRTYIESGWQYVCEFDFREEFWGSIMRLRTVGMADCRGPANGTPLAAVDGSWPPRPFTTTSQLFPATSTISPPQELRS